jgi:hypothetical protein
MTIIARWEFPRYTDTTPVPSPINPKLTAPGLLQPAKTNVLDVVVVNEYLPVPTDSRGSAVLEMMDFSPVCV